jgi:hypothetical protein
MKLPVTPSKYQPFTESTRNRILEQADAENHKRDRDINVGKGRVILTASDGSRWALVVAPGGALSTVAA